MVSGHDLHKFMEEASNEMASEYARVYANAASDPGSAGDEGERNWAEVLQNWLPPSYHVATKGRLISQTGELSPQVDVVVLKPSYPLKLRSKGIWLAGGVAAAFECKNTLTAANIKSAVERAVKFKELFPPETGTPWKEMKTPLFYGLLAHSHSWKSPASTPEKNVIETLERESFELKHPRLHLDGLCVADLGFWKYNHVAAYKTGWAVGQNDGAFDVAMSFFNESTILANKEKLETFQPIGALINSLIRHLAWRDTSVRDIASYYNAVNLAGMGHGSMRPWRLSEVYSHPVVASILSGRLTDGDPWNEWSISAGAY